MPSQLRLFATPAVQLGRIVADVRTAQWLRSRGVSPFYRPRERYSRGYCAWLGRPDKQRAREAYDALTRQRWLCWHCRGPIGSLKGIDLHHPLGYGHLGDEDPSELVAIHRYRCHRMAHEEMKREQQHEAHWRKAA